MMVGIRPIIGDTLVRTRTLSLAAQSNRLENLGKEKTDVEASSQTREIRTFKERGLPIIGSEKLHGDFTGSQG